MHIKKSHRITSVILYLFFFQNSSYAKKIQQTLYINAGIFTTVDTLKFPYQSFNSSKTFNPQNSVIHLGFSDTLFIKVINNDTAVHGFKVQNLAGAGQIINPNDSITQTIHFSANGIYIYYDHLSYPVNRAMGLAGMICVSNNVNSKNFYWNFKEHQRAYNLKFANNEPVDWNTYYPDYFTINGKSHPDLQKDSTASILANLGDTVYIFMANTGQSKHSIHFHGFHSKVLFASQNFIALDTEKDTYPLGSMQCIMLQMIPDKIGRYGVHDHNLVAVSGGGKHPNGMFIIMTIE